MKVFLVPEDEELQCDQTHEGSSRLQKSNKAVLFLRLEDGKKESYFYLCKSHALQLSNLLLSRSAET